MDSIDRVRAAYDQDPEHEWQRLKQRAQMRLEYLITLHALERHLPAPDLCSHILDAGGGPGRYTIELAKRGYQMTLYDLSPALLHLARQRIAQTDVEVQQRIKGVIEGSITDMSCFPAEQFDAVLCLGGPLSHLVQAEARRQALRELVRVMRAGALLFISVLNRLGAYRSAVQWPDSFDRIFADLPRSGVMTIGPHDAPVYLFVPEEFVAALEQAGLSVEHLFGCNGIGAHLQEENLLALIADPQRWPLWCDVLLTTSDHPHVIGVSNHVLAVARRNL
jgi:2-polyprenyl-3-methyl-5-hydroxy-6-metoxy-1,4-benzoquinol methylase